MNYHSSAEIKDASPFEGQCRGAQVHLDEPLGRAGKALISRRSFCDCVVLSSTGMLISIDPLASKGLFKQYPNVAYPAQKIEGAERLMPGESLEFYYPTAGNPAILVRAQSGEYYAYGRRCTHLGCSVSFSRARRCLACPCHNGAFDLQSGAVLMGPPLRPLDLIVLQMRGGGEVWAVGKVVGSNDHTA